MNVVQILRSTVAGRRPTGRAPGELYVNFTDGVLGYIDGDGLPVDLQPGGADLPADAAGVLTNDGFGVLSWTPPSETPAVQVVDLDTPGDASVGAAAGAWIDVNGPLTGNPVVATYGNQTWVLTDPDAPAADASWSALGVVDAIVPNPGPGADQTITAALDGDTPLTLRAAPNSASGAVFQALAGDGAVLGVIAAAGGLPVGPSLVTRDLGDDRYLQVGESGAAALPADSAGVLTNDGTGILTWGAAAEVSVQNVDLDTPGGASVGAAAAAWIAANQPFDGDIVIANYDGDAYMLTNPAAPGADASWTQLGASVDTSGFILKSPVTAQTIQQVSGSAPGLTLQAAPGQPGGNVFVVRDSAGDALASVPFSGGMVAGPSIATRASGDERWAIQPFDAARAYDPGVTLTAGADAALYRADAAVPAGPFDEADVVGEGGNDYWEPLTVAYVDGGAY